MKLNKFFILIATMVAALGFTACSEEESYVPGAPAGKYNVGFVGEENLVLGMTQNEIDVTLVRANGEGELEVPIQGLMVPDCVTLPASAKFANGETETTITVKISEDMKMFTEYALNFCVPEEYTNPYAEDAANPIYNMTFIKEDFKVVANGVFTDQILFKDAWEQPTEYSEILGLYRWPNCFAAGGHWYFQFDGENFNFCDAEGNKVETFASGYVHKSYGMIMVDYLAGNAMGYDPDEMYFYMPLKLYVSAGSFGSNYEYYEVSEWLEKPWEK